MEAVTLVPDRVREIFASEGIELEPSEVNAVKIALEWMRTTDRTSSVDEAISMLRGWCSEVGLSAAGTSRLIGFN